MIGLELFAPQLVGQLRVAPLAKQRAATIVACKIAIGTANVLDPIVTDAIEDLRVAGGLPSKTRGALRRLANRYDNEYFKYQEAAGSGGTSTLEYLSYFAKARAVTALVLACERDAFKAAVEAIYEAAAAVGDDKDALLRRIERELGGI